MKFLLRHLISGLWVSLDGTLTPELQYAAVFATSDEAEEYCVERHLQGVDVILRFSQGIECTITHKLPVAEEASAK
jgi:hypothetical protein